MRLLHPRFVAALLTLAGAAQAQTTSPQAKLLEEGHRLALTLCSVCHVAAADQSGPPVMKDPRPPFSDIANRPEITPAAVRTFLRIAHASLHHAQYTFVGSADRRNDRLHLQHARAAMRSLSCTARIAGPRPT